ncbi:RNA polymerase II-associated protein 1-like isoform X2 [Amphibalanus amphitrite]|uniref:RNA polymerase II-associated protein 1-like isoform X2 n=1 Tax=Amphibalanus amphitrite TaxID=1232801 RepID=UPI001C90F56F|nr:RNA polymerase II-associated protein 1-like isoform X2 [Amphibalanus amphitrite]
MEALLDCRPDEVCLDRTLGWSRGLEQPSLPTTLDTEPDTAQRYRSEEAGLKDDAVTRLDAVRALVRVDALPRVRYLLEVARPPPSAVVSALRLLTRCCRHSLQLAAEVASCPRLLDTVVTAFLPVCGTAPLEGSEPVERLSTVYGVPLHHALKLLRVLSSQSGQLAGRLVRLRPRVMEALLSYVAINPGESGMPTQEVLTLAIESYRLWAVLLSYNLADTNFIEFFPLLVRQLHFCLASVSVNDHQESQRFNHDLATWILVLCRTAVCAAFSNHQTELLNKTGVDLTSPGALRWGHVAGLLDPVEQCTRKWLTEAARADSLTDNAVQMLGACCQFLAAFHERWARLGLDDTAARIGRLQTLADVTLAPFVTSQACLRQLEKLREFSSLLSDESSGRSRDPASLPSLGAVSWETGQVAPVLRAGSPVPLLTALLQLIRAVGRLHPGLTDKLCLPLVSSAPVSSYLSSLAGSGRLSLSGDWFTRHEVHLVTELLLLQAALTGSPNPSRCHTVGLRLLPCLQTGDEHLCAELMRHVVFNRALLMEPGDRPVPAVSESTLAQLVSSYSLYERCLLRPAAAAASRDRADSLAGRVAALATRDSGATLLPADWWYAPLVRLYERNNPQGGEEAPPAAGSSGPSGTLPPPPPEDPRAELYGVEPARVADRCLQLLAVLFSRHRRLVDALSVTAHFARVCCVFLAGDDLFLDPAVQRGLRQVLQHVLEDPDQLDLTADVPGLASFGDLYTQLLDQFEGVSYGDALFGAVILVPLLPRQPAELRRALWIERPLALRAITTRPEQMLIPLELYLSSVETDAAVLKAYRTALQRGTVTAARNPALHRIATALVGPAA